MNETILDTGTLVGFLHRDDQFHQWARRQLTVLAPPLLTCEAVLTEAHYILRSLPAAQNAMLEMVKDGLIKTAFQLESEIASIETLLTRYKSVPMSFADACLVRMSEIYDGSTVWTTDSDFLIYRKNRRRAIPIILPAPS